LALASSPALNDTVKHGIHAPRNDFSFGAATKALENNVSTQFSDSLSLLFLRRPQHDYVARRPQDSRVMRQIALWRRPQAFNQAILYLA
jgi:hypothetical protein